MSVSGAKSTASAACAARSVASVQGWPSSAASACAARFTIAAMPPKARRTRAHDRRRRARSRGRRRPRRCRSRSAWRSCRRAPRRAAPQRHLDRLHELAGLEPVLHVVEVEVGERHAARSRSPWRSTSAASSAISTGALSPIGEPLATLPPIVPAWRSGRRGEAQPDIGQRRPARDQGAPGVLERGAGADREHAVARLDALQVGDVADVDQVAGRSRNCLLTHRPMSVEPARRRASGWSRSALGGEGRRACAARRSSAPPRRRSGTVASERIASAPRTRRRGVERARPAGRTCARRHRGSAGSRCSGTGCRTARRRAAGASAACRARRGARRSPTATSRSPGCRSRIASRGTRPSPAAPGAASPSAIGLQVLDREQRLAVERGQELDAGVDVRRRRPPTTLGASPAPRPAARRRRRCRRRSRLRCSLPWCRCSARPRAASRARCASGRRRRPRRRRRGGRSGSGGSTWASWRRCRLRR